MRIAYVLTSSILTLLAVPCLKAQLVIYANLSNSLGHYLDEGAAENGDQIQLAPGTPRVIQDFTFEYWLDPAKFTGTETVRIRFYANDGPALGPTDPTPTPGTILYDSGVLGLAQAGQVRETVPQLHVTVPDTFTWTAQFNGGNVQKGKEAGVMLYSPPSVGANQREFWQKDSSGWNLYYYDAYATDFGAELTAVAQSPVLAPIPNTSINEGTLLTIALSATDPDPKATLVYSLLSGPDGMSVDPDTGVLTWTPTEAQGPGTSSATVRVADKQIPSLQDTRTFTVTVNEVNQSPTLAPMANQSVAEGGTLAVQLTASDPDLPSNKLTYSLVSGPAGVSIDPNTGLLTWSPAPGQGANSITVRVTDDGSPPLSDTKSFRVTVTQQFPTDLQVRSLGIPSSVVVGSPVQYSFIITNRGPVAAGGVLLRDLLPQGATVTSATASQGTFLLDNSDTVFSLGFLDVGASATITLSITPMAAGVLTNRVVLTSSVADLDPANNSLEERLQATATLEPVVAVDFEAGDATVSWSTALSGYHVESTQDLQSPTGWHSLNSTPVVAGAVFKVTEPVKAPRRFYRLAR